MKCFLDGKACDCKLDSEDCLRDPFRAGIGEEHDEEYETIRRFSEVMDDKYAAPRIYG